MKVCGAPPVGGVREHLGDGHGRGGGLVAGEHMHARDPAGLQIRKEFRQHSDDSMNPSMVPMIL